MGLAGTSPRGNHDDERGDRHGNTETWPAGEGWSNGVGAVPLGEMYHPVFFVSTVFAIHGDADVPVDPVSHGCIRIPMDIAAFFHTMVETPGTKVFVYT
jgi:lipoprotein-anchoring transpeptidase ErfK/SrfK